MPNLSMSEYDYELPPEAVADRPLLERADSRLEHIDLRTSEISHRNFSDLLTDIPEGSLLLLNSSRVIPARLPVTKKTGGAAEVLLLQPVGPYAQALGATDRCLWSAMIGGKRIGAGDVLNGPEGVTVHVLAKDGASAEVELHWSSRLPFGELLERVGRIPLPPYLHREDEPADRERYQTVYADEKGSVAAPTAGLHFTPELLQKISEKARITHVHLHVGAGTFKPVDVQDASDHEMHAEIIHVPLATIEALADVAEKRDAGGTERIIAVGTTSLRTLESLALCGARLLEGGPLLRESFVALQWDGRKRPSASDAALFRAVATEIRRQGLKALEGPTQLMITPGFEAFRADRLITNFHQPRSTLLLLVAAFSQQAGTDFWKTVYADALQHGFRFLSYGDSSIWIRR